MALLRAQLEASRAQLEASELKRRVQGLTAAIGVCCCAVTRGVITPSYPG